MLRFALEFHVIHCKKLAEKPWPVKSTVYSTFTAALTRQKIEIHAANWIQGETAYARQVLI